MKDHFVSIPKNKYNIIYADPPWSYNDRAGKRGAAAHYKTMSIDQMCEMNVSDLAAENCILFMWVTMPMILDSARLFKAWGFDYKTVGFTWIKKTTTGLDVFGMGRYTRANPELCLIGVKGKFDRQSASVRQLIRAARPQRHSEKPAIIRKKIVELCGDIPRIELFARQQTPGWNVWGNEV